MKEFLSRERRPFLTKNVDDDPTAYDELLALGYRAVPVTLVNGQGIKGFDEPALRRALESSAQS